MKLLTDLITLTHPLLHAGIPHLREPNLRPLPTPTHFVMFDYDRVAPQYAMCRITPDTEVKDVERDDDFVPDDRLPSAMQTYSKDYSEWNKDNPDNKMDRGHLVPSQVRRANKSDQHWVDSLSGVIPETPALNRMVKSHLETEIVNFVRDECIDAIYVAGPSYSDTPETLDSGQHIPTGSWISVLYTTPSKRRAMSYLMLNVQDKQDVGRQAISLETLELVTGGLVLWDQIPSLDRRTVHDPLP